MIGSPANSGATGALPVLFRPRLSIGVHRPLLSSYGNSISIGLHPAVIEIGTDPISVAYLAG
jgi:glutaminase